MWASYNFICSQDKEICVLVFRKKALNVVLKYLWSKLDLWTQQSQQNQNKLRVNVSQAIKGAATRWEEAGLLICLSCSAFSLK